MRVLFVGINPGIRSAAIGHHFAGYSNRFWKLLYESRLVPEPIETEDDHRLPEWGFGMTNLIPRPTAGIDTLRPEEYVAGLAILRRKIRRWRPEAVALVGVTLYRAICGPAARAASSKAKRVAIRAPNRVRLGLQARKFEGAHLFVLPNPSGRNANFSYVEMLAAFRGLRTWLASRPEMQPGRHDVTKKQN